MGKNNKKCPRCGHKMKQQFIGLQHCSCGMSWKGGTGFFERTPDMVFCLRRQKGSAKQSICIETRQDDNTILREHQRDLALPLHCSTDNDPTMQRGHRLLLFAHLKVAALSIRTQTKLLTLTWRNGIILLKVENDKR